MSATICTCIRRADGQVLTLDPDCPAYPLHVAFPTDGPITRRELS